MDETYNINGKQFKVLVSREELDRTIDRIAAEINRDYKGKSPLFVVVLKGAIFFAADLLRKVNLDCEMETISAKSYGQALQSSGNVVLSNEKLNIKGRDVIIVEDIIDNGFTLKRLTEALAKQSPASLEIAVLLSKPDQKKVDLDVKYKGLEIAPEFVVGFGLDYAERGRNLPALYSLHKD